MAEPFLFLFKLAWESRYRIPLIITIGFMALDIRMQFEINIQMGRIRRARGQPIPYEQQTVEDNIDSDGSSDSWLTIEEEELDDEDMRTVLYHNES